MTEGAPDVYHEILTRYWGYTSFRPLQEEIIHSVASGKDTLGLMTTGGGKSLTFQVPALTMEGICLVVTPLIALMKDQVDSLKKMGIKATAVYSGLTGRDIIARLDNCIYGDYKFLYISPERLGSELFLSKLQSMCVSILVVDESHCISQWGYDFRPAYLSIAAIRDQLPGVPVLALTATARPEVVGDIQEKLLFREKNVFRKSFQRDNISYVARREENKMNALLKILNKVSGSAIVYVRNRAHTKELAVKLQEAGVSADFFHAGLNDADKDLSQRRWKNDECRVMVSTNAFGMGIDKPDVRLVVHMGMPDSLEEYFQEAGRAGRDGKRAYAVALYGDDHTRLKKKVSDEYPEKDFIYRVYEALGNYFRIAVGYGLDTIHEFLLRKFCYAFGFSVNVTHHALKILDLSGYIEYTDEVENASRLVITVKRDDLYKAIVHDSVVDKILGAMLRRYTGLFTDYVYIDELWIAKYCLLTREIVYDTLIRLSKCGIVSYIPRKKIPHIIYARPREEQKYLVIPRSVYEERKERFENRISEVLDYIDCEDICRSKMLLYHFGERDAGDCGCCDTCLKKNASGLGNAEFNAIRKALLDTLTSAPYFIPSLVDALPFSKDKVVAAIRFLLEHDERFTLSDGCLSVGG
ncbi:MAG: RecQ family ATP-dependent DNA helicase [Tannerellaceae bacterium]|jgi:ATP-dependent DNA helicase RecQ|nr:RecQ family ATP-dependent DNA helicase [Tannerellaceae bacterium]